MGSTHTREKRPLYASRVFWSTFSDELGIHGVHYSFLFLDSINEMYEELILKSLGTEGKVGEEVQWLN